MNKLCLTILIMIIGGMSVANAQSRKLINIGSPVYFVAPIFPAGVMPSNETVRLQFTVTKTGDVDPDSIEVIETSNVLYNQSAVDALSQFRYAVRTENGQPVATPNSRTKIEYAISVR